MSANICTDINVGRIVGIGLTTCNTSHSSKGAEAKSATMPLFKSVVAYTLKLKTMKQCESIQRSLYTLTRAYTYILALVEQQGVGRGVLI